MFYGEIPDKISDFIGQVILKQALIDFNYFFKISGFVESKRTTLLNFVFRGSFFFSNPPFGRKTIFQFVALVKVVITTDDGKYNRIIQFGNTFYTIFDRLKFVF